MINIGDFFETDKGIVKVITRLADGFLVRVGHDDRNSFYTRIEESELTNKVEALEVLEKVIDDRFKESIDDKNDQKEKKEVSKKRDTKALMERFEKAKDLMAGGKSQIAACKEVGIHPSTFYYFTKKKKTQAQTILKNFDEKKKAAYRIKGPKPKLVTKALVVKNSAPIEKRCLPEKMEITMKSRKR